MLHHAKIRSRSTPYHHLLGYLLFIADTTCLCHIFVLSLSHVDALEPQLGLVLFRYRYFHLPFRTRDTKKASPPESRSISSRANTGRTARKTSPKESPKRANIMDQMRFHHADLGAQRQNDNRVQTNITNNFRLSTTKADSHDAKLDCSSGFEKVKRELQKHQRKADNLHEDGRSTLKILTSNAATEATDNANPKTDRSPHSATYPPQLLRISRVVLLELRGHEVFNPFHHSEPLEPLSGNLLRVVRRGSLKASGKGEAEQNRRK